MGLWDWSCMVRDTLWTENITISSFVVHVQGREKERKLRQS